MNASTLLAAAAAIFTAHGTLLANVEHEGETLLAEEVPALVASYEPELDKVIETASTDTGIPVADFDSFKADMVKAVTDFLTAKASATAQAPAQDTP